MRLTPELLEFIHQDVIDPGPIPDVEHFSDEEYAHVVDELEKQLPSSEPVRVFAYGSLIWNPEYEVKRSREGKVFGWHRAFCMHIERFRGSRDVPGLMMGLERGGSCRGVIHEISMSKRRQSLDSIVRREMITQPCTYEPRWLPVHSGDQVIMALAMIFDRKGVFYRGGLDLDVVAERISKAVGHLGSNAEYLMNTNRHLEEIGVTDRNLCKLEHKVATLIHVRQRQ
ncbi:MAG: gamma-glutamylcyclotransferase [Rhodospirillales bacterium]|jgi:cation transport protein ChaC|nr:gamma-glutamylcyclotransferase [Rhodospirillales bacterium]